MFKHALFSTVLLVIGFSAGCKDEDPCAKLSSSIKKASEGSAKEVDAWLKENLTGPDGEAFSSAERKTSCAMILGDKDALAGYQEAASAAFKK